MNVRRPSISILFLALGILLSTTLHLAAQQPSQTTTARDALPVYDVASIRQNKSDSGITRIRTIGDGFNMTNVTLVGLLMNAYDIREDLMSNLPAWATTIHFDINAKISDPNTDALKNLSREQRRAMMLALLTDRFHLRTHIVTKTLPVYDLVLAKGGSKLKEDAVATSTDPGKSPSPLTPGIRISNFGASGSEMTGVAIPISMLAPNLAFQVERNVIDKTGLTGKYDIHLKWTPTELQAKTDADNNAPDLFTALQEQLGLKLEPSKGPVDTLVIDHVEMPSEN